MHWIKRHRSLLLIMTSLMVMLLIGTACGGGGSAPSGGSQGDSSSSGGAAPAPQQDKVFRWTMQSYSIAGTEPHQFIQQGLDRLRVMSGGRLDIELHPGGGLVGYADMLEALQTGSLDLTWNAAAFFLGQDPAFAAWFDMPGVLPQDPRMARQLKREWMYKEGVQIAQELYDQYNAHIAGFGLTMNEPVHSKFPIEKLADFQGKKFRAAPGLIQAMFEKVGAIPIAMPGGEIYNALDTGVIDGAEFVGFTENFGLGIHEVTSYVLYPGFHSQVPMDDLTVNKDRWNELPDDLKMMLEDLAVWVDDAIDYKLQQRDMEVMEVLQRDFGITINSLSAEEQAQVQRMGVEATQEWASQSPMSQKLIESMFRFLEETGYDPR